MKLYDLCIINKNIDIYKKGTDAIIIDMDEKDYYHLEIWDFDKLDGADLNYIDKKFLRKATKKEEEEYLRKFNEYIKKNEN